MCRNCGALVGANEASCSLCGAPKNSTGAGVAASQTQAPQHVHDHETVRFARAVLNRPYIFTIAFLVANIFIFMLTSQSGAIENPGVLIRYGAKVNAFINGQVNGQHEWWRFVTPIFLHGGIAHLLMNMYGLWVIGPYVEKLYGSAKFVVFWVLTGVAGVVASYLSVQPGMHNAGPLGRFIFKSQDAVSVGASGALFGLIGVLFVFGIKFRHELPEGFKRAFGTGMLPTILLNIFIGYMIPVIDNAAHMGGLVAGASLALAVNYKRPGERGSVAVVWHILQVAALALVAVSFLMVARNFNKQYAAPADMTQPSSIVGNSASYLKAIKDGNSALIAALNEGDVSGIDEASKELEGSAALDARSGELRDELKSLLARAKDYTAMPSAVLKQERAKVQQQRKLVIDFEAWEKKFDEWVKTEGGNYGLYVKEPSPAKDSPKEK
jgi:membrane associated rhomboid family serine protease